MGTLTGIVAQKGVADALEHTLSFVNEIDGRALSEALLGPKPRVDSNPHLVLHGEDIYISKDGAWELF